MSITANVEKYALQGEPTYDLPIPMNNDELNFSFSGLKSSVINLVHNENQRGNEIRVADMCNTFQERCIKVLAKKAKKAVHKMGEHC